MGQTGNVILPLNNVGRGLAVTHQTDNLGVISVAYNYC